MTRRRWRAECPGLPDTFVQEWTGLTLHNTHWYRPNAGDPRNRQIQYMSCENCWSVRINPDYRGTPKPLIHKGRKPRK